MKCSLFVKLNRSNRISPASNPLSNYASLKDGPKSNALSAHSAFTIVELMVVLGLFALLVSLILPALAGSLESARLTRELATVRNNAQLIASFCNGHQGAYPMADPNAGLATARWYRPLVENGYFTNETDADPTGAKYDAMTIVLSLCMVYDPAYMRQGWTVPLDQAKSVVVKDHQVTYPADKGLMHKLFGWDGSNIRPLFCCGKPWKSPVAMADGSASITDYTALSGGRPVVVVDSIGAPVYSTWGGYLARDRQ